MHHCEADTPIDVREMHHCEADTSRLHVSLDEKDVSFLDEIAELSGRLDGLHHLKSFGDGAPRLSEASKSVNSTMPVSLCTVQT